MKMDECAADIIMNTNFAYNQTRVILLSNIFTQWTERLNLFQTRLHWLMNECKLPLSQSSVVCSCKEDEWCKRANRTVQSTELFIGTCKLLSIFADVTMKVTSNLLTNSNLWSIQTLLVLTTANTFYYKTDFRTAAATFYCCEPSSTCPDQQCLTQGSRLNQQDFSLPSDL